MTKRDGAYSTRKRPLRSLLTSLSVLAFSGVASLHGVEAMGYPYPKEVSPDPLTSLHATRVQKTCGEHFMCDSFRPLWCVAKDPRTGDSFEVKGTANSKCLAEEMIVEQICRQGKHPQSYRIACQEYKKQLPPRDVEFPGGVVVKEVNTHNGVRGYFCDEAMIQVGLVASQDESTWYPVCAMGPYQPQLQTSYVPRQPLSLTTGWSYTCVPTNSVQVGMDLQGFPVCARPTTELRRNWWDAEWPYLLDGQFGYLCLDRRSVMLGVQVNGKVAICGGSR